ncbi:MAG: TGS domain-containing protein [Candidatus Eisenbacteria bacterium]|nr:TGS domain-containing protein [Candidatus Eisenbacteria bacterium]
MPANLTPDYREAEQRFRQAASHEEKLVALREMLALLPKHKGTEKIHADLRHRIAKLEEESQHAKKPGAHRADPGHVHREGAGQWALIGPPNAGKSRLLAALTHAHPEVAPYPFTTHAPQPGMMPFEDVQVQLVDTPAVAAHHVEPYMTNLVRNADGVALVLDLAGDDLDDGVAACRALLERARVWPRSRPLPPDASPLLAVRPVFVVANKRDLDGDGTFAALARESLGEELPFFAVSAERGDGLEELRRALFAELGRIRIYAKEPGRKPDHARPFVLAQGATVYDLACAVHKDIAARLKYARIWGHARFDGQQVDRDHVLTDRDVVELHA